MYHFKKENTLKKEVYFIFPVFYSLVHIVEESYDSIQSQQNLGQSHFKICLSLNKNLTNHIFKYA